MLRDVIEEFVEEFLPRPYNFEASHIDKRDPIHSLVKLQKHETVVVKTPLFQRLKRISQMGVLNRIFDYVTHTRYSHCIGVTQTAGKILEHFQEHYPSLIDTYVINNVRMSALLHDIGHGPFSHLSEQIISKFGEVQSEFKKEKFQFANSHEIIGYYIIMSDSMHNFLDSVMNKFQIILDYEEIANYIIGQSRNPSTTRFIAEIINGAFDADKLDYTLRDTKFIGTKTPFEPEFLINSLRVGVVGDRRSIIMSEEGIDDLMDLMYHKLKISRWIYDPRVRIADSTIHKIFELIIENEIPVKGKIISSVGDMLRLNESDILDLPECNNLIVNDLVKRVRYNNYYIPSVILSERSISSSNFFRFFKFSHEENFIKSLSNTISEIAECSEHDIIIDLPYKISMRSLDNIYTIINEDVFQINDLFPYTSWLESYINSKWRGCIFCKPKFKNKVGDATKKVFQDEFGVELNRFAFPN